MDRSQKEKMVDQLKQLFTEHTLVVVTHYAGLTVANMTELRGKMREAGASREEIRQQINAMLVELGIEVLAKSGKGRGLQLSSEQKAMVKQLLAKRTSPSEIRQALTELAIIDSAVAAAPSRDSSAIKLRFTTLGQVKMNNLK